MDAHDRQLLVPTRRDLVRWGVMAGAALLGTRAARAAGCRSLSLYAVHSGERLQVEYCVNGRYQPDALDAIALLLRDRRAEVTHAIDTRLLDGLARVGHLLGTSRPLHVVCGYRTRRTNEERRRHDRRVARDSFHVRGQAVDFYVPGRQLAVVRRAALAVRTGGVGYYPASGFVHLDSGPARTW